jgi:2-(1,2-epoxy-1,2-dihydrophenyl)acetyl-CoA isomerase
MSSSLVLFDTPEPSIARITLNRPDRLNAYTPSLCAELLTALVRYRDDDSLRVLILTGAGRGFCAGGDVRGDDPGYVKHRTLQLGRGRELRDDMHAVNLLLHRIDKPVLGMVNGVAVSGGLALALMCDYRIAAASARLGDPSGRMGLLPDEGGAWMFPRFMGIDRALMMVWLNEIYDAEQARELGLVSEVVPDDELVARTMDLARKIATRAPLSVRVAKLMMRRGLESTLESSLGDAQFAVMFVNTSHDAREGMTAFQEKRAPVFTGE